MLCHPNRLGKITVWPRLETGNSSVAPWSTPRTMAWNVVIRLLANAITAGGTLARVVNRRFRLEHGYPLNPQACWAA